MFGTVAKYNRQRAFGFIVPDSIDGKSTDELPDFFVCPKFIDANRHLKFLVPGQRVEFDPVDINTTRPYATNVKVIGPTTIARQTNGETTAVQS
jgi:cold shock CspA family protein